MFKTKCDCLECRIRRACEFDQGPQNPVPAVMALINVLSECLAHVSDNAAMYVASELLLARNRWLNDPLVDVQATAAKHG